MSLKKQFITSTMYIALAKYLGLLIQLLITSVLSRLLSPDVFGLVAITSVFVIFFGLFADMGIGPAIIQQRELSVNDIRSIFSFTCCSGLILAVLFVLLAPLISMFYEQPVLLGMCRVLSLGLIFTCMSIVPNALLLREKMFKYQMFSQLIVQIISGIVGILAALKGLGVYALIIYSLFSGLLTFIAIYLKHPILPGRIQWESLRKIAGFSTYQFLFNFINYFARNLDNLLTGKYLSPAMLGYYEKSYRLMLLPVQNLTHVMSPVIQPYFSEFQDDKNRIFELYMKIVKVLAMIGFPLSVFLYFSARELILIVFGSQWEPSIPVFELLACSVGIQVVLSSSGSVFQAANDTKRLFYCGLLSSICMVTAICCGVFLFQTIEGIGLSLFFAFLINFSIAYYILIHITLQASLKSFMRTLIYPLLISIAFITALKLWTQFVHIENILLSLLLKTIVAAFIYFPMAIPVLSKEKLLKRGKG